MKTLLTAVAVLVAAPALATEWTIDPVHTTARFTVKHMMVTNVHGEFGKVTGDLTLHGVTKPVVLEVEGPTAPTKTPFGTTVRAVHATGKIDRKDFEIGWTKVLDNGGVLVGNEVTLDLNAELSEKVAPAAETAPAKPAAAPAPKPAK